MCGCTYMVYKVYAGWWQARWHWTFRISRELCIHSLLFRAFSHSFETSGSGEVWWHQHTKQWSRPSPGLILAPPQIGLAIFAMEFCTLNCQNKYVGLQLVEVINTTPNVQQMFRHDWATQGSANFRPVNVAKTGIITILHLHTQILHIDSTWWISCLWLSEWKRWSSVSCSQIPSSKTWKNQTTTSENPTKNDNGNMARVACPILLFMNAPAPNIDSKWTARIRAEHWAVQVC